MKKTKILTALTLTALSFNVHAKNLFSCVSGTTGGGLVESLELNVIDGKYVAKVKDVFGSTKEFTDVKRVFSTTSTQLVLNVDGEQKTTLVFTVNGDDKKAAMVYTTPYTLDVELLSCK